MIPPRQLLLVTLGFFTLLTNLEKCIGCQRIFKSHIVGEDHSAQRAYMILDESIYNGDSISEFLSFCPNEVPPTDAQLLKEAANPALLTNLYKSTKCDHPVPDSSGTRRKYTRLEMFYLKKAQKELRSQQQFVKASRTWLQIVDWLLFLIPLLMIIFLGAVGHFDYLTLPLIGYIFQTDATNGLKFKQHAWMQFLVLPGNHSMLRGQDPNQSKFKWLQYKKRDEAFDWRTVTNFTKFNFLARTHDSRYLSDEEVKVRTKKQMAKGGWDFLVKEKASKSKS